MDEERYDCSACNEAHTEYEWNELGMVCARCGKHTGNNTQGHHWSLCKVYVAQGKGLSGSMRESHFCCPDDCELEAKSD